jgi:hopanoid biosynthesis associated RND transporter like protein HpnN
MTTRRLGDLTQWCGRHARAVAAGGAVLGIAALAYMISHFAMTSDTTSLLSPKLAWRQREIAFDKAFPSLGDSIVIVVDGQTPELAGQGADNLAKALSADPPLFPHVEQPDGGPFLEREGLLLLPYDQVKSTMDQLDRSAAFLGPMAADPSLRGVMSSLQTVAQGAQRDPVVLGQFSRPAAGLAAAVEQARGSKPVFFSWRALMSDAKPGLRDLRRLVIVRPHLDLDQLEPGAKASAAIRAKAKALGLDPAHGVTVRLTGSVPLSDEEFASLEDGAAWIGGLMITAIVVMLFLAVRSWRLVGAILGVTFAGLAITATLGLLIFGRFNLISVAFIPLFVGLGVDFGIQYSVRYRAERAEHDDDRAALTATGVGIGRSLTLAAVAITLGFLGFLPTSYVGVSQLGVIAGLGMVVALGLNLTVLPALIVLLKPAGMVEQIDLPHLAQIDAWLTRRRRRFVLAGAAAGLVGLALSPLLRFDFNPLHLKNQRSESVTTLFDLGRDPDRSTNSVEVLSASLPAAQTLASKLSALPQVSAAITLDTFIPPDQGPKLARISDTQIVLDPVLNPFILPPPPTDAEDVAALKTAAAALRDAVKGVTLAGADPLRRLAGDLDGLAAAPAAQRTRVRDALLPGLNALLDQTRAVIQAQPVSLDTLPADLRADWLAPSGQARISVTPRGDGEDNAVIQRFTQAVQKVAPDAVGAPIAIQAAGKTIADAFLTAGVLSFLAITVLLFWVLRRPVDVAYTLAPIVLTGLLTIGTCVAIGLPLNDANIIAFPLLFGIGVAFQIYFVMAWRGGEAHLLKSSLARAIFFSALTTGTGFGSLALSNHPGTAGMGKLLMIALLWTLVTALIFQPALMGPPKVKAGETA